MDDKQLTLGMLQLIDVGTVRGAWQGAEIESVAVMRKAIVEKIKSFQEEADDVQETLDEDKKSVDKAH